MLLWVQKRPTSRGCAPSRHRRRGLIPVKPSVRPGRPALLLFVQLLVTIEFKVLCKGAAIAAHGDLLNPSEHVFRQDAMHAEWIIGGDFCLQLPECLSPGYWRLGIGGGERLPKWRARCASAQAGEVVASRG